jgi:hypothetical protein
MKVRNTTAVEVRNLLAWSPVMRQVPWQRYHVKDGAKGPMVWEAGRIAFWIKDENGLPSRPHHLMVARNVLKPDEVKYFLSNASQETPVEVLLLVAFSRRRSNGSSRTARRSWAWTTSRCARIARSFVTRS